MQQVQEGNAVAGQQVLFVFSDAFPGRESDYQQWYLHRHLPDMKQVPGVDTGDFFRRCAGESPESSQCPEPSKNFAAFYTLGKPCDTVLATVFERSGSPAMPRTDSIDRSKSLMLGATALQPSSGDDFLPKHSLFVALTNELVSAADTGLDRNSDSPGEAAMRLFRVAESTANKTSPASYLLLWDVDAGLSETALLDRAGQFIGQPVFYGLYEKISN